MRRPFGPVRGCVPRPRMVHVTHVDAPQGSPDCTWIRFLFLSRPQKISPDEAYRWLIAGGVLRVGSEEGPKLLPAVRGTTRYVRTKDVDAADDPLLLLPRRA